IDIDPAEIGKNVDAYIPIVGDVKRVLQAALDGLPRSRSADWLRRIEDWKRQYPLTFRPSENALKPQWVIRHLYETTGGDAIVTTDVGQHQMWVAQYFRFARPRSFITSGGLGTMGFGFPAALGAQIANPDRLVICVTGDGGFQMTSQELAIAALENLPVKVAIINNRCLGMVRQWQEVFYQERYSEVDLSGSPDFVKLAEAYGVKGLRARTEEEAKRAWQEALAHPGPVVVDFEIDPEENVYPMVAPGSSLDEMIMGDEEA